MTETPQDARRLPALACAAILLTVASIRVDAQQYFRSNAGGMQVEPITAREASQQEYVLVVDTVADGSIERLRKDGKEIRRRETHIDAESRTVSEYRDGVLALEETWSGNLKVEERRYTEGALEERTVFDYTDDQLSGAETYDADGKLIRSLSYDRTLDGRLYRAVSREGDETRTTLYRFSGEQLYQAWLGADDSGTLYRYSHGDVQGIERWSGTTLVRIESVELLPSGSKRTIDELATGRRIIEMRDTSGRLIDETVEESGVRVERTRYRYSDDLLVEKVVLTQAGSDRTTYEYTDDGTLSVERLYRNSVLLKVTFYTGDDTRYEEVYRNGAPVLRVYFEADQKTREEVIR